MKQVSKNYFAVMLMLAAAPLAAQEPTPAPAPQAMPAPAVPAQAPTAPTPAWAPVAQGPRRGWFGVSLSCEECFIQRGPGRVSYIQAPAILSVESGSPAWQAGIRTGDTLVSVDGMDVTTADGFERFANAAPGSSIRVGLRRAGQSREVSVTPTANNQTLSAMDYYNRSLRIAQRSGFRAFQGLFRQPLGWLGMAIDCEQCSVNMMPRRGTMSFRQAPAVYSVDSDGPAVRAGIHRGDTLTAIDGVDLTDPAGGRAFAAVEPGQHVTLTVRRDGRERRLPLVAVARPDATPEELAAFEQYKKMKDSSDAQYREVLTSSLSRAQEEIAALQRSLRDADASRMMADSSRHRLYTIDSALRAVRTVEGMRASDGYVYSYPMSVMAMPTTPMPSVAVNIAPGRVMAGPFPLRYSGRLKDVANVEVRSVGAPQISEVGDSLIVVTATGVEVKVQLRQH